MYFRTRPSTSKLFECLRLINMTFRSDDRKLRSKVQEGRNQKLGAAEVKPVARKFLFPRVNNISPART